MNILGTASVTLFCLAIGLVLVVIWFLFNAIKIVSQYERLVIFRLGKCVGMRGPGLVWLIPGFERGRRVDLREQVREIPHQVSITKDNAPISIDFLWFFKVVDPVQSVLQVVNFEQTSQGMATTMLRSVIGGILLDEVLSQRENINMQLRAKLDEVTERWGVKVENVEIREIIPPREVQDAMNRQMTAERIRRATVTESEGNRDAAINVAEGGKKSAILQAEGERQANILRAEGFSQALKTIFAAAQGIDQKTMTLQYFDTLKVLGTGPATKFIFPLEFTQMITNFLEKK
ncbi:MAG: SPFH domain-containing protein [Anaerolineales bacterium]|jgi:regulator of protease activity HflC (stomatin/prohibitin superfamily)